MKRRTLGRDFEVSAIGLGCMGFTHAYGKPMEESKAIRIIQEAVSMGYTLFDTAERYTGFDDAGNKVWNEELVGKALLPYRHQIQIATKFGITITDKGGRIYDSRPQTIRKSVEGSLKRLHTDYIDLYLQHRMDPITPIEDVAAVISDLIKEGKILHWGLSNTDEENLRRANAVYPVTCVENRYSLMARWEERLFPVLEELGIGFIAFSPLANGMLSGAYDGMTFSASDDYRSFMPQYQKEGQRYNKAFMDAIEKIAGEKNITPAQLSLAWMLSEKDYIVPIPGSRNPERLKENAGASEIPLSEDEISEIGKTISSFGTVVFSGPPKTLEKRWDS